MTHRNLTRPIAPRSFATAVVVVGGFISALIGAHAWSSHPFPSTGFWVYLAVWTVLATAILTIIEKVTRTLLEGTRSTKPEQSP